MAEKEVVKMRLDGENGELKQPKREILYKMFKDCVGFLKFLVDKILSRAGRVAIVTIIWLFIKAGANIESIERLFLLVREKLCG